MNRMADLQLDETASGPDQISMGALRQLAGYHLRRASSAFAADFARALAGTGMRQVLLGIMSVIDANPGISQGLAGNALGIQRANMVALINDLVDRGLVDRQVSKQDRRAFELSVTPAGKTLLSKCLAKIEVHEARMLADLDAGERETLFDLLSRIEAREPASSAGGLAGK
jgi:DNA-binding MarR family transcriptional regulator